MSERSVCIVPLCPNSSAKYAGVEYICSRHWALVPTRLKRRRSRVSRLLLRRREMREDGHTYTYHTRRAMRLDHKLWFAIKQAAIRGAAGL